MKLTGCLVCCAALLLACGGSTPADEPFDPEPVVSLLELVIDANEDAARRCLSVLAAKVETGELAGAKLEALRSRLEAPLAPLLKDSAHGLHQDAVLLAASWGSPPAVKAARDMVSDMELAAARRLAALRSLVAAGDEQLLAPVSHVLLDTRHDQAFRGQVISALGGLDDPRVAKVLLAAYGELEPELRPRVIELLTQRVAWSKLLLAEIGAQRVPADALSVNQVARLLESSDEELADLVREKWGSVREERSPQREQVIAQMRQQLKDAEGDPHRGLAVFAKVCGQCHKLYGEGQEVGPDLTSNGRASFEQLLSNVFDPNLVIGAAYQPVAVRTDEGRTITGLLVEDSPQRLVLKLQGGKLETVPRDAIEAQRISQMSLMPEGLEKQINATELADLFALLTLDRPPSDPQAQPIPGAR